MSKNRGPNASEKCPFYVLPDNPLSAEASVNQCAQCATCGNARLKGMRDDFRQLAYLTIMEEEPKYDPNHPSGASFVTFIKSRVCYRLQSERRKEAKYTSYSHDEPTDADCCSLNPLVSSLLASACASESIEDEVCMKIEVEQLRSFLPQLLSVLGEKEREVITLKFLKGCSGIEISQQLRVSEGRVSQLLKTALPKLKKALLRLREESLQ